MIFHEIFQRTKINNNMISDIFANLTGAESMLFIIFQILAFVLGMICMWFLLSNKIKESRRRIEEHELKNDEKII